jgi:hypothetical protein
MATGNRRCERVEIACQSSVAVDELEYMAVTENLSINGLSVFTNVRLPVGKRVSISMYHPLFTGALPITIDGVVARNHQQGMAFEFISPNRETSSLLNTVIRSKLKRRRQVQRRAEVPHSF